MDDLISREAAHDIVRKLKRYAWGSPISAERHTTVDVDDVQFGLDRLPAVDAEPVRHGRWIGTQYDGYADGCPVYDLWECSECREEFESEGDPPNYRYCPNCGAKMDGGLGG